MIEPTCNESAGMLVSIVGTLLGILLGAWIGSGGVARTFDRDRR